MLSTPGITIEEALARNDLVYIDVRSPAEFARASIPGAINIPLLNDAERKELGSIYHSRGDAEARRAGLQLVSSRLPRMVMEIDAAAENRTPLFYCWRGGLRSASLCQILALLQGPALRLKGGYRAFRRYVHRSLQQYRLEQETVILRGLTGVGKTALIRRLRERGYAALDLEELAQHHGSVFGAINFPLRRSQKDFEALLLQELQHFHHFPYIVMEGEGKRIGDIHLPPFLTGAMERGVHLRITAPLPERVKRIVEEYLPRSPSAVEKKQLQEAVQALKQRLGREGTDRLLALLETDDYHTAAEMLCTGYYDYLYLDSRPGRYLYLAEINTGDLTRAAGELTGWLDRRYGRPEKPAPGVVTSPAPADQYRTETGRSGSFQ